MPLRRLTLPVTLAVAVLFSVAVSAQRGGGDGTRERLQAVEAALAALATERAREVGAQDSLRTALQRSEVALGELRTQIRTTEQGAAAANAQLATLAERRAALETARQAQQQDIAAGLLAAYRMGRESHLKVLLSQSEAETVARALAYHRYIHGARQAQIAAYRTILARIDALEPELEASRAELAARQAELEAQAAELAQVSAEREQALQALAASIQTRDQQIAALERDRQELEELLEALAAALALEPDSAALERFAEQQGRFAERQGRLPWPLEGRIENRFGSARSDGRVRWQGVRLAAERGTIVRAIHPGRVVFADWLRGSGLLLILDHGDGYMSLYANNDSLLRDVGEVVASGAPLSTVGASGGSELAGLYFEIRHNGKPQDPTRWCSG